MGVIIKRHLLLVLILILSFICSTVSASEMSIFGPTKFIRTTGDPNVYSGAFSSPFPDNVNTGKLIVLNGNQIGEHRVEDAVSSAEVYINGQLIFGPSDFSKNVYYLEAPITLSADNSYHIELRSAPDSYITINIVQDFNPPTVTVTAEPEAIKVNENATLTWNSVLAYHCTIEPGIGQVDASGTISVSPDETTLYTITATGPSGETSATVTITHVNSLPVADDHAVSTDEDTQVPITLTASDLDNEPLTYHVVTNPTRGILSGTAPNLIYTPHENENGSDTFTFKANDGLEDSNLATVSITINPVNDAPVANGGPDQTVVKGDAVFLDASGSSDADGDALSYQWLFLSIPQGSAASFSDQSSETPGFVPDQAGAFELQLVVFDGTEYSTPDFVMITAEPGMTEVPNLIGLTQQAAETALNNAGLTTGSISQTHSDTVPEGSVINQDPAAGTVLEIGSAVDLVVSLGAEILAVTIDNPIDMQTFTQDTITVTGTVNRPGSTVLVNGIVASVAETNFMAEAVPLTSGANTIKAVAVQGDDTAEYSITVMFSGADLEPIQLTIGSISQDPISLKVAGQALVSIRNNGDGDITSSYYIALFEDSDNSRTYDRDTDNLLGRISVPTGPLSGQTTDVSIPFSGELLFRDNPLYVILDSEGQLQETDESNNLISNRPFGMDLSTSHLSLDSQDDCPSQGSLSVRLGNSGGLPISAGVPIAFYDGNPDENGALIGVVTSTLPLNPGDYEDIPFNWTRPSTGVSNIYCSADDDGTGTGALDETDEKNNTVSAEMNICTGPPPLGAGSISGTVMDAVTGVMLPNATVFLHVDQNGEPGMVIAQATTSEFGWFIFTDLGPGAYILVSSVEGYITGYLRVSLAADQGITDQNMALSPILAPEEIRIVLTWGKTPEDLEAHLTAPNPDGCRYQCFYWNRNIPGASLDRDDRDSYGPETITITQMSSGVYRFYVHDFTNRLSLASQALSQSGAKVTVYFGSGSAPVTFDVPNQAGTVWHVFNIDGNTGAITLINKMTFQDESGKIDFPVIRSFPQPVANWGESYSYQVQAEDPDLDSLSYSLLKAPQGMTIESSTGLIQWTPSGSQGGSYAVKIRVQDGRCGEDTQEFSIQVEYRPIVSFSVEPCTGINPGGNITLSWSVQRAETVTISQGIGEVGLSGTLTIPSPETPVGYLLTATNGAGQSIQWAPNAPQATFGASPSAISPGGEATLTWTTQCATSCSISPEIGEVALNGSITVTPQSSTTYTLTAKNGTGSQIISRIINIYNPPLITFFGSNAVPSCTWMPADPVELSWQCDPSVTHCTLSPGVGEFAPNGSITINPDKSGIIYTLKAFSSDNRTDSKNLPLSLLIPMEIKSFTSNDYYIDPGQSVNLSWSTQCANTCTLDQGIGDVATSGSVTVTPNALPMIYTLTATNGSDSKTKSLTIHQDIPYPSATFSVSPTVLKPGESATLTWSTQDAVSCTITPGVGDVPLTGSLQVDPGAKTTYILEAKGINGTSIYRSATVSYVSPSVQILASPEYILAGQSSTLSWVFSNATQCTIDQGIGEVSLNETRVVTPFWTTTYTITASGPGGAVSDSVTVNVNRPPSIYLLQPSGGNEPTSSGSFTIKWSDEDPEDNADISLFYDTDNAGEDGTLIVSGLKEDPDGTGNDEYVWDASQVPDGAYYIYAVIEDGNFAPVVRYSDGVVIIARNPLITVTQPDGLNDYANTSFIIKWTDQDIDDNAMISIYYDTDDTGEDGTLIASGISEDQDGESDAFVWNTANIPEGAYYVYAVMDDGKSPPFVKYSTGPVVVSHNTGDEFKLIANDRTTWDYFGGAVSISGDYAILGAPGDGPGGKWESGSAYIFKREGPAWIQMAKLEASDAASYDRFGFSVSISGDYAVVGACDNDDAGSSSGSAYIFRRDGTAWVQEAKLTAGDAQSYDLFGYSVSISGDYVVVGADGKDDAGQDSGAAYVFEREGTAWVQQQKLTAGDATSYSAFGYSISISGDSVIVGAIDRGAAYIFVRQDDIWTEQAKLTVANTSYNDYFGCSVSICENTALVGAYGMYEAGSAAYVFERDGSTWREQAKLTAGNGKHDDYFGYSVSISGNYAVVGAYRNDDSGWNSGSAYVYKRKNESWLEHARLTASDATGSENFGYSVAMDGGFVIAGAYNADNGAGSAYVFPVLDVSLTANPEIIEIGGSTTLSWESTLADYCTIEPSVGIFEGNGSVELFPTETTTYTISATSFYGTATDSVTVYVSDPANPPAITITAAPAIIAIGESSTLSWDIENAMSGAIDPGIGTVAFKGTVSVSPTETTTYTVTATNSGHTITKDITITVTYPPSIKVLQPDGTTDLADEHFRIQWDDSDINDNASISLFYDTDNTGEDGTLIVSGLAEDPDGGANDEYQWNTESIPDGYYYVYAVIDDGENPPQVSYSQGQVRVIHTLQDEIKQMATDAAANDTFGWSVSVDGDYAIVGAYGNDDAGDSSGSAYIFKRQGAVWAEQAKLTASDAASEDYFGYSVAIDGDYAIVGARGDDDAGDSSGSAYIFRIEGSTWVEQAKLTASDADAEDYFGYSVAIDGDYAIVGAQGNDDAGDSSGSAYIFRIEGSTWVEQAKLTARDAASEDYFGISVSLEEDYAIVGATGDDDAGNYSGSAYIFKRDETTWSQQAKLRASDAASSDFFGRSVSINGDYAAIGAFGDDDGGSSTGSAYIFKREGAIWSEQAKLAASDAASYNNFGTSVSLKGNYVIVGAYGYSNYSGAAYIFERNGSVWNEKTKLTAWDRISGDYFGYSASLSQNYAIVGAYNKRNSDYYNVGGAVYFYPISNVKLSSDREFIQPGETANLSWDSFLADSCAIEPGIGTVGTSGTISVSPAQTTSYIITATGPKGTNTASATVYVVDPSMPPSVNISAEPVQIGPGGMVTLTWNTANADSCIIEPGIGAIGMSGSIKISPTETTTYTITASNSGGTATASATVTVVYPAPVATISAAPLSINQGESTTLSWSTTSASSCVIEPGIGEVNISGSMVISPTATTTYTITATGLGGTTTASVTVTVLSPTVTISANPATIQYGQSSTLTWSSTNATGCTIEPNIGEATTSGSISVSPTQTTTYTITATGFGGATATASFTVTVMSVQPAVTISADPASIVSGQSSTLTWSSTNASSCVIEPTIGAVNISGSISVSPTETTTYTITATGPGGTATKTATVTVTDPAPTVSIIASPQSIYRGNSTTLSWSSTNATICIIEPDVGEVDTAGSVEVSPTQTTTYTITATGLGGNTTVQTTVTVTDVIHLQIISPVQDEEINKPFVMVKGTFSNALGLETGITVNGQVAMTYGNEFVANHVPLEAGANTITAYAVDSQGNTMETSIVVNPVAAEKYLTLTANEYEGVSPFETNMTIEASFNVADVNLSYFGTGLVTIEDQSITEYGIKIDEQGIYYLTVEATDSEGATYEDTIAFIVLDASTLDTLLRTKWNAMKSSLINNDIEGALKYFHAGFRDKYRNMFNLIGTGRLAEIAAEMRDIEYIYSYENNIAKYVIKREKIENGSPLDISYFIYFVKDGNGIWKIENF